MSSRIGSEVLDVLRLRRLDGEPVLVERTVYAGWIADAVAGLEPDADSVTQRLHAEHRLVFAYGRHLIDAVAAGTTTDHTGRPVETSEDRYRPGAVTFEVHNSIDARPLTRADDPAWSA
jgi:GntR family transcriptional regulator